MTLRIVAKQSNSLKDNSTPALHPVLAGEAIELASLVEIDSNYGLATLAYGQGDWILKFDDYYIDASILAFSSILKRLKDLNFSLSEGYTLIGLEGCSWDFKANSDSPSADQFNDLVILVLKLGEEVILVSKHIATTEPGKFYTVRPLNINGAARMMTDTLYSKVWRIGAHKRIKQALVQARPITIVRDGNKDFMRVGDKKFTGEFGINCHHAYDSATIGQHSAGCQVVQSVKSFSILMQPLLNSGQKLFDYILLDYSKVAS